MISANLLFSQSGSVKSYKKISDTQGSFYGTLSDTARFGCASTSIGDLDNDGVTDFAVGSEWDDDGGQGRGAVWILFMKSDGTVKDYQKISFNEGNFYGYIYNHDHFGCAVASLGDLDNDGVTDIAVGAKGDDENGTSTGSVYILFLKTDGTVKDFQKINNSYGNGNFSGPLDSLDWFGYSIANIGDFNGDGITDIAVGAPQDDDFYGNYEYNGDNYGAVWILMLDDDGTVKSYKKISADPYTTPAFQTYLDPGDNFGNSIASIGDVNGDGVNDLAIGAPFTDDGGVNYSDNYGAVYIVFLDPVYTLKPSMSFQCISSLKGDFTANLDSADYFGISLAAAGDINGDNIPDVMVGAHKDDDGGTNQGAFYNLFLTSNGKVDSYLKVSETTGGFSGSLDSDDQFAYSMSYVGDVNGDGDPDLLVGAVQDDDGATNRGAVWLLNLKANHTLTLSTSTYNPVCYGYSTGTATVSVTGGVAPYSYQWDDLYAQTTATCYGLAAGTYSVDVTDANGTTATTSVTITQPSTGVSVTGVVTDASNGLSNGSINISVSGGTSPYSYNWSNWEYTQDISGLSAGSYSVWVYDDNGCFTVDTFVVGGGTTTTTATISGTIESESGSTVNTVTVALSGNSTSSDVTSSNGQYSFTVTAGESYTITPSKSNDIKKDNGISTLDLLLMQEHILQLNSLSSPYKIIAADVDESGSVSTLDILYTRSIILQTATSFPNGKLWSFVNSDYTFSNPLNPFSYEDYRSYSSASDQTQQDFIAVKLGDVNDTWDNTVAKTNAVGDVYFMMDDVTASANDVITVPVKVKDFNLVTGYQFTVSWDPTVLEFQTVNNTSLSSYFGTQNTANGKLSVQWNDNSTSAISLADNADLFNLQFKVIGNNGMSSNIEINSDVTLSEAYNQNFDVLNIQNTAAIVQVDLSTEIANIPNNNGYSLCVYPNPLNESSSITFSLPENDFVQLAVYNLMGQKIADFSGSYAEGINHINMPANKIANFNGCYLLQFATSSYNQTEKLIISK